LFDDFDPRRDYPLTLDAAEMTDVERNAASSPAPPASAGDVDLDLATDVDLDPDPDSARDPGIGP
jgi:hypothetical protein